MIDRPFRRLLSKVPEVTVYFWIVKILSITVGETLADFLSSTLRLGLTLTTAATSLLLAAALLAQFRAHRYIPALFWLVVVLIGIVGTLLTDGLVDNLGVPLPVCAAVFAVALALTFVAWHRRERTLSIHTIDSPRREAFYWLAVLFAFALGTAGGDLAVEVFGLGYPVAVAGFAALTALAALAWRFGLDAVPAFWLAYVVTRPLGAALGDLLSQPADAGGLGLGTLLTSLVFLVTIAGVVGYLTWSERDRPALGGGRIPAFMRTRPW
jgi:uncharacterized membrane-anchored protein